MSLLVLGTAQFGLDYGISNKNGKIIQDEVNSILSFAHSNGINILDTASAYGDSETVLGTAIQELDIPFNIVTKYPANQSMSPLCWIDKSLQFLNKKKIYGYLFHSYATFQEHPEYLEDFIKLKEDGRIEKIGFSLYYPLEAEYIINNNIPCDIVQVPYNIFDRRFAVLFPLLKARKIDIHIRSVFLQGLFFIQPENINTYFSTAKDKLIEIHKFAHNTGLDISSVCFGYVNQNKNIDKIVIGVDSLNNLINNINAFKVIRESKFDYSAFESLSIEDERIILPFNWRI